MRVRASEFVRVCARVLARLKKSNVGGDVDLNDKYILCLPFHFVFVVFLYLNVLQSKWRLNDGTKSIFSPAVVLIEAATMLTNTFEPMD